MYCKNCGEAMNDNQAICLKCGVQAGTGNAFCSNCGQPTSPEAAVCLNCGVALKKAEVAQEGNNLNGKDKIVAALLAFFLGGWGIHNFYMGETKRGIMKIVFYFVCGISGILALIDFIKILIDKYEYNPDKYF